MGGTGANLIRRRSISACALVNNDGEKPSGNFTSEGYNQGAPRRSTMARSFPTEAGLCTWRIRSLCCRLKISARQSLRVFLPMAGRNELPNDRAKIADLKVITRTSVMQYKNTATRNLPEIAQAFKWWHTCSKASLHYRPGALRGRRHSDVMLQRSREALTSCTKQSHAQHDGNAAVGQKNIAG